MEEISVGMTTEDNLQMVTFTETVSENMSWSSSKSTQLNNT